MYVDLIYLRILNLGKSETDTTVDGAFISNFLDIFVYLTISVKNISEWKGMLFHQIKRVMKIGLESIQMCENG